VSVTVEIESELEMYMCFSSVTICTLKRLSRCWESFSQSHVIMPPDPALAPADAATAVPVCAVIADDERLARKKLELLLEREPLVSVVAECEDGRQTVSAINSFRPDLLLLDIQMPDLDGFQVLSEIPPAEMPVVIFTSAYDQYAIRAFEAHALDYLLKPFDQARLHQAIERARQELLKSRNRDITYRLLDLLSQMKVGAPASPPGAQNRLVIKANGRVIFLSLDEIDWVEAAANYIQLNAGRESYLFRETISRISERLDPKEFIRIHRSTIVNVRRIKELIPVNSGEYIVVLKSGKELSCSRGYRAILQQMIERHL
jgi:two-component system LytT family response regulator